MQPNLEHDLLKTDWIVQKCRGSTVYSQNLYAALCNNDFYYGDDGWGCSWRMSGGIVADIRDCGETYIDWYCSGMSNKDGFVGESFITDEIRLDLLKIGWTIKEEKMPKVTITFDLPEEQSEFDCAINAGKFKNAVWNFEQQLRSFYKYHHDFKTAHDAVQGIRACFYQCLKEHNVSTD